MKNKTNTQHNSNHGYWAFNPHFKWNACTPRLYDYVLTLYLNLYDPLQCPCTLPR